MAKYESVETVIDRFLEYVRSNGQVSLSNVASALAINPSQAERIAILLEQSGFLELKYGIGDVTVSVKKKSEAKPEKKPVGKNALVEQSEEIEREILTAENLLKFFERDISRRIQIADELLKDIEEKDELDPNDIKEIEREVDLALGQLAAFSQEIKTLADKEEHFYNKLFNFKKKLDKLQTKQKPVEQVSLLHKIIAWIKTLFSRIKQKKPVRMEPRKKRKYDSQSGVVFLGSGQAQEVFKKRVLKTRTDRVKQHYWKRRKKR